LRGLGQRRQGTASLSLALSLSRSFCLTFSHSQTLTLPHTLTLFLAHAGAGGSLCSHQRCHRAASRQVRCTKSTILILDFLAGRGEFASASREMAQFPGLDLVQLRGLVEHQRHGLGQRRKGAASLSLSLSFCLCLFLSLSGSLSLSHAHSLTLSISLSRINSLSPTHTNRCWE